MTIYYPHYKEQKLLHIALLTILAVFVLQHYAVADITASRLTGVAPLYVSFFETDAVESDGVGVEPFHDYEYTWSFGDSASGTWGTDGASKNSAKGPVAAHVYDNPGLYTVNVTIRNINGVIDSHTIDITVLDPGVTYQNQLTTCVNNAADDDFTGCPDNADEVQTDDIATLTGYAEAGERILFKRGGSWTVASIPGWPNNGGPVTFGAYGSCTGKDKYGICSNAPQITVGSNGFIDLNYNQDVRVMDLAVNGQVTGGSNTMDIQQILFYRLAVSDSPSTGIGWSHWNDSTPITLTQMAVISCRIENSNTHAFYGGGEHLALMGNYFDDSGESHLVRVWQGYRSVLQHNIHSRANTENSNGRLALKFHGPGFRPAGAWGPAVDEHCPMEPSSEGCLENPTQYAVVSDNVFGGTAYQVSIAPQDTLTDSIIRDVIFERNLVSAQYAPGAREVAVQLVANPFYLTIRNNVFDATGATQNLDFILLQDGAVVSPTGTKILNNTFYRGDASNDYNDAVVIESTHSNTVVRNNYFSVPLVTGPVNLVNDSGTGTVSSHNVNTDSPGFVDPNNVNPLHRDFSLTEASTLALGQGYTTPLLEDYFGNTRSVPYDIGACMFSVPAPENPFPWNLVLPVLLIKDE